MDEAKHFYHQVVPSTLKVREYADKIPALGGDVKGSSPPGPCAGRNIFTVGPLLTAYLALQVALPLPLMVAAVLTVAGSLALAAQRRTQPPPSGRRDRRDQRDAPHGEPHGSAMRMPGMAIMVVAALGIGGVFGSYEVTAVAFAQEAGQPTASGLILGLWAAGSLLGGLAFGSRQWRASLPRQVVALTGLLAVTLSVAPFVPTIPLLAVTTFIAGITIAPALIAVFSLTERLVPAASLTEGLTWTNSGMALGFSFGTALAGVVIDGAGTSAAFAIPCISAALACAVAASGGRALSRASAGRRQPPPTRLLNVDPIPGPAPGGIMDDPDDVREGQEEP